jgi:hypothetical protein
MSHSFVWACDLTFYKQVKPCLLGAASLAPKPHD